MRGGHAAGGLRFWLALSATLPACSDPNVLGDGPPGSCAEAADTSRSLNASGTRDHDTATISIGLTHAALWRGFTDEATASAWGDPGVALVGVQVIEEGTARYVDVLGRSVQIRLAVPAGSASGQVAFSGQLLSDRISCHVARTFSFHTDGTRVDVL